MRMLLPEAAEDIDPVELHAAAARPTPPDRPWVLANMIASLDGAATVEGRSGGLGGPGDRAVFRALRGIADVVLVGAGTVRAEQYRAPRSPESIAAARRDRGQSPDPLLAVVSGSLDLDADLPLLGAEPAPIIYTGSAVTAQRRRALAPLAEIVDAGADRVELDQVLDDLRRRGASTVLAEGGPGLLAELVARGLLDELNLTVAPWLVGGDGPGVLAPQPTPQSPVGLRTAHLLEDDGWLFVRSLRAD